MKGRARSIGLIRPYLIRVLAPVERLAMRRLGRWRVGRAAVNGIRTLLGLQPLPGPPILEIWPRPLVTISPGRYLEPNGSLPTVLVVLLDLDERDVMSAVDEVARCQIASRAFKPVFVTTAEEFGVFLRHGFLFEYMMPSEDLKKICPDKEWENYIRSRLGGLLEIYLPVTVLTINGRGSPNDLQRSLWAVAALRKRG